MFMFSDGKSPLALKMLLLFFQQYSDNISSPLLNFFLPLFHVFIIWSTTVIILNSFKIKF